MTHTLWNMNGHTSAQDLVDRIRASVARHSEPLPDLDQALVASLDLVAQHLERLQTRLGYLQAWVGQDAELSAQRNHELDLQLRGQSAQLDDLRLRLRALESAPAAQSPADHVEQPGASSSLAVRPRWPDGHFYSPVVDAQHAWRHQDEIWPPDPRPLGIDFNHERQRRFVTTEFPRYLSDYDYPDHAPVDQLERRFYSNNAMFGLLDSRALFVMLRSLRPRRMIEVGSGFSSLLTADVNRRFFHGEMDFTCIEPTPPPMLANRHEGISRLIERGAQQVDLSVFQQLHEGDVLFIDSSHVAKAGSDVNYLVFEVLPRLKSGVVIHFHDIPLPFEYPREWVLTEGRSWNELYIVRALLMFSDAFEFLFGSSYAMHHFWNVLEPLVGRAAMGGGSIWLRKTASPSETSPLPARPAV